MQLVKLGGVPQMGLVLLSREEQPMFSRTVCVLAFASWVPFPVVMVALVQSLLKNIFRIDSWRRTRTVGPDRTGPDQRLSAGPTGMSLRSADRSSAEGPNPKKVENSFYTRQTHRQERERQAA